MASLIEHHAKALSNLQFLTEVHLKMPETYDWQVTIAFYVGVHLVNGHMKHRYNREFTSHSAIIDQLDADARSSFSSTSDLNWCLDSVTAYARLRNMSREARYMHKIDNEKPIHGRVITSSSSNVTRMKDLRRSISYLDAVCCEFVKCYPTFPIPVTNLWLGSKLSPCTYFVDRGSADVRSTIIT